jgi:two-component system sensor histidine kinase DesK
VYAAGTVARLTDVRRAAGGIAAIAAAGALIGIATDQGIYSLFATLVVVPLIGAVNMHQVRVERTTARLRAAHDEVRRLAAVAERERIGRDLHDVLGHTLSLIVLKSELASKVAAHDAAQAVQEMRDVERVARAALDDVRQTIRGYRPALSEEIERARMLLNAAAIESQIDAPAIALAPAEEETLAFAIREGVTNVVRHSGARHVRIVLMDAPDGLTLEISDDGAGTAIVEGGGLSGMRDRVTALGGSMRRESARGTHLIVRLPRLAA